MIDKAVEAGAREITLEVRASNHAAQALYRSMGFVVVGVRKHYYYDNGEDAILMTLFTLMKDLPNE
jgi:ribosomal-protein-alanine N-acetyltransferase